MRASARASGRDPDEIELTIAGAPSAENVRRARTLGAQRFLIDVYGTEPDTVGRFIEEGLNDLG
jgi:hypothetical protein